MWMPGRGPKVTADYSNRAFYCGKPNSTLPEDAITSITGCFMAHRCPSIYLAMFVGALSVGSADARSRSPQGSSLLTPIMDRCAHIGSIPARSFLPSLSFRLQIRPDGK